MPLSHRRGILSEAAKRQERRRREAKENGIILEKATKSSSGKEVRRERGIGGPSIGKFQGGMLKLSKRDVADIEGPKKSTWSRGGIRRALTGPSSG